MSQFGCYTLDRLYCKCGECPACIHRNQIQIEKRAESGKLVRQSQQTSNDRWYIGQEEKPSEVK